MSISDERSDHGLTVEQTLAQSKKIHPDWTAKDHYEYLVNDAFFSTLTARRALGADRDITARAAFHDILSGLPE